MLSYTYTVWFIIGCHNVKTYNYSVYIGVQFSSVWISDITHMLYDVNLLSNSRLGFVVRDTSRCFFKIFNLNTFNFAIFHY